MSQESPHTERLSATRAREILESRFITAGLALQPGYPLQAGALLLTLDAYDPRRNIGFIYTDTEPAAVESQALAELAAAGSAHVLLVQAHDVPTLDALERYIDAFFSRLPRQPARSEPSGP